MVETQLNMSEEYNFVEWGNRESTREREREGKRREWESSERERGREGRERI